MSVAAVPRALWSRRALAEEFEVDPRRVTALLRDVHPAGELRGHPAYHLRDVAGVLVGHKAGGMPFGPATGSGENATIGFGEGQIHPDELPPKERKEWYDGERVRKGLLRDDGDLVPAKLHRDGLAEMARLVRNTLSGLADTVDATFTLSPEVIDGIDEIARAALEGLAEEMEG